KGTALGAFRAYDKALSARAARPREIPLRKGVALRVTTARVRPHNLLVTYEDVSAQKSAEAARDQARADAHAALERQTATSEILRIISRSPADLRPVFEAILSRAIDLCEGDVAILWRFDGRHLRVAAHKNASAEGLAYLDERPLVPNPDNPTPRAALERRVIHEADIFSNPRYRPLIPRGSAPGSHQSSTQIAVPLLAEDKLLGVVTVWRVQKKAFTEKQVALLETFAAQAAIAIENVRLFNETKEALERQTATAEILEVMAGAPTDVQPVFDAIARNAARLLAPASIGLSVVEGDLIKLGAVAGPLFADGNTWEVKAKEFYPFQFDPRVSAAARAIVAGTVLEIPDVEEKGTPPRVRELYRAGGARSSTQIPLILGGKGIGSIGVAHPQPGFRLSDKQLELMKAFAAQAAIAIENVRMFNETKEALERQTATSEILRIISRSPADLRPVFEAILSRAIDLCEGDVAILWRFDGRHLRVAAHKNASAEGLAYLDERPLVPNPDNPTPRAALERRVIHEADIFSNPRYRPLIPRGSAPGSHQSSTQIAVPLLAEDKLLGVVTVWRVQKKAFTEKQVALLETFAAQAAIAIENVRLFNETKEALERQTATAEILEVMAGAPTDVQPVFDAIARNAARLLAPASIGLSVVEGDLIKLGAVAGPLFADGNTWEVKAKEFYPFQFDPRVSAAARAIVAGTVLEIPDVEEKGTPPRVRELYRAGGARSSTQIPLILGGKGIGSIGVAHPQPGFRLSDKQLELMKAFAAQAAIAIENVRLFNETKEALERQTATAEILKVIAGSPTDVQPVFDAIVNSAARLFTPSDASVHMIEPGGVMLRAIRGPNLGRLDMDALMKHYPMPAEQIPGAMAQVIARKRLGVLADTEAPGVPEHVRDLARDGGFRSVVSAPLIRDGIGIGAVSLSHPQPNFEWSEAQRILLQSFADQAVIAIENVRLFNELEARNREVTETLQRQTATAEILKVMASSPSDVQPVFDAIASSALKLFDGLHVMVALVKDNQIVMGSYVGPPELMAKLEGLMPIPLNRDSLTGRVIVDRKAIAVGDMEASGLPDLARALAASVNMRALLGAPMLREGKSIGAIILAREKPGEFSPKQVALLETFADQAVIAIENARLFNETKEALERQTATSQILEVISRSQTDLQPVFDTIADNAMRLCDGDQGVVGVFDGELIHLASIKGKGPEEEESTRKAWPRPPGRGSVTARAVLTRGIVHVPDVHQDPEYEIGTTAQAGGWRSVVSVPMLRGVNPIGAISVTRRDPIPFSDEQIALLKTFADQAVIAIENTRLFKALEERNREVTEALERQTATAEILSVISGSPTDERQVFDAIVHSARRLCSATYSVVFLADSGQLTLASADGVDADGIAALHESWPRPIARDTTSGRAILDRQIVHMPDSWLDPSYTNPVRDRIGLRSILTVPMFREGVPIGAVSVWRGEPKPFTDKQIELLKTFADQAVIAIENVRLFNETKEALERQTATAEILKVISESPTDVQPVFDAILES
ncbi:MAG: GAF domain-containing protein, partial [Burkholderiales bacterium]